MTNGDIGLFFFMYMVCAFIRFAVRSLPLHPDGPVDTRSDTYYFYPGDLKRSYWMKSFSSSFNFMAFHNVISYFFLPVALYAISMKSPSNPWQFVVMFYLHLMVFHIIVHFHFFPPLSKMSL